MRNTHFLLFVFGLLASGCVSSVGRNDVVKQATFDHDCPQDRVKVLDEDTDIWAYRLDVCGKQRKYRNFGKTPDFQFVDVTDNPSKMPEGR